ncbi:MAG: ABC transporter permease [Lewinellaceae bacterium]|nr:ABC transporter permease [Phaeodactylibacter sp.]MCB0612630.1 ABC transporter permease [Phaeodactylibacter sp.]MCB9346839.1 ABC transporter permease [Lewinellaceae bacterium]
MLQYLLKRILIFIPTLLVISLLAFGLSRAAPGDPVEMKLRGFGSDQQNLVNAERIYRETAAFLGLNKPAFYIGLSPAAYPDTLYNILKRDHRENLSKLIAQYGNWEQISAYYQQLLKMNYLLQKTAGQQESNNFRSIRSSIQQLFLAYSDTRITSLLEEAETLALQDSSLQAALQEPILTLHSSYEAIKAKARPERLYIPDIKWYGLDNQYHNWLAGFLKLDFGLSYYDSRPVADKMNDALFWTILINGMAILLAYLLSIPLGVFSAIWKGSVFDRSSTILLFILYSLPSFWIGTMLLVFFTTPEYGMDWFPSIGLGNLPTEAPFWNRFWETASHLGLPVFCLSYGALAFISRQMRGGMLNVIRQDYIRTAWAKGLSSRSVIWKHAFRNALFPIITLFANIFPAVFAGSVAIEVIFNIPGMGKLTIDAITQRDWPVVYTVLMLSAILTMAGILVADFLYAWADPRVSYSRNKQ